MPEPYVVATVVVERCWGCNRLRIDDCGANAIIGGRK